MSYYLTEGGGAVSENWVIVFCSGVTRQYTGTERGAKQAASKALAHGCGDVALYYAKDWESLEYRAHGPCVARRQFVQQGNRFFWTPWMREG